MKMQFFWIDAIGGSDAPEALNSFLSLHRIVNVEKEFSQRDSGWAICVQYLDEAPKKKAKRSPKERIDYREILPPEVFRVFAALRKWRKELSEKEGFPAYSVASNDQLVEMAEKCPESLAALEKIKDFGSGRVAKYGETILRLIQTNREKPEG